MVASGVFTMLFSYRSYCERDTSLLCWYQFFSTYSLDPNKYNQVRLVFLIMHTRRNLKIVYIYMKFIDKVEYMLVTDIAYVIVHHFKINLSNSVVETNTSPKP